VQDAAIELRVVGRARVGDAELVEAALPDTLPEGAAMGTLTWVGTTEPDGTLAFLGMAQPSNARATHEVETGLRLWVRRSTPSAALGGTLFTPAGIGAGGLAPGHRTPFTAKIDPSVPSPADLERRWGLALATELEAHPGAFYRFAADRVRHRYGGVARAAPAAVSGVRRDSDLSELMDTMTGRLSVQEAIQRDRSLFVEASRKKATIPIGSLRPPALSIHPWKDLLRALGTAVPDEPFARATPAEFYFVRARSLTALLDVTDAMERWGQPAADLLDGRTEDRGTFARYQTELGLERTFATRMLGPELVKDLAIVGSDPYVHEGTDLTVLFHAKNAAVLGAAVTGIAAKLATEHGGSTQSSFVHEGVTVAVQRSGDGAVRQHTALADDVTLVSNSAEAMRRVISTIHGKHPRLADQPDFAYMLARDRSTKDDVLAYLGDGFIGAVVGPKQKIAEARRQIALSELSVPGYAALLYGMIYGKAPRSADELVASKLLDRAELRHHDGAPITWTPDQGARSRWGSPAALEPSLDLPAVTTVSEPEERGYRTFAASYEMTWSDAIDPIALRVEDDTSGARKRLGLDLRVLPLLRNEYRDFIEMVGRASAVVPDVSRGARVVLGIGKEADLRRELQSSGRRFGLGDRFSLDWVGDYAFVGVADRNELSNAVLRELGEFVEMPSATAERSHAVAALLQDLPVYAAIQVRSRVAAALALGVLREIGEREAADLARWDSAPAYRGTQITTVTAREGRATITLYYGLTSDAVVAALNEAALHVAIDALLDAPPRPIDEARHDPSAAQSVFELAFAAGSPLYRSLAWGATAALLDEPNDAPSLAEAVLRGDPGARTDPARARAVYRAVLGVVPLTLEGKDFTLGPDGVAFPPRGTINAPVWPELPVPGSPLEKVLGGLARFRTALSFEDEPGSPADHRLQSLHAHVTVDER
jgi:hypothetical protein